MNISEFNKPVKRTGTFANLTKAQDQKLKKWLSSEQTYEETIKCVERDFGIRGVTIGVLKNFRLKYCAPKTDLVAYRPPFVTGEIWEFSLQKMVEALRDPKTRIETRVRISAFFLQLVRMSLQLRKLKAKDRASTPSKPNPIENNTIEEPNPLDDQDKLDEVRRQVFGSAPNPDATPTTPNEN